MSLMQLPPPTKAEMLAEIDRELRQRAFVYPKLIANGKLRQATADRQNEILRAVRAVVERLA